MPVLGEPLTLRNAIALVSAQTVYGTPVTPATGLGDCRASNTQHSNNRSFRGPGSANRLGVKGGLTVSDWRMAFGSVTSAQKPMLLRGVRSSGVLPQFTLGLGYKDDTGTPNKLADEIQDCKVGSLELSLDTGDTHNPITANLSGMGGLVSALTSLVPAALTTQPYMSYECAFSDGSAFPARSFRLSVNHNLRPPVRIPGATPSSFQRGPFAAFVEGDEVITGSVSLYIPLNVNVQANTLTSKTLVTTFTNLDDSSTLVITCTGARWDNHAQTQSDQGILWSADFEADSWSLA